MHSFLLKILEKLNYWLDYQGVKTTAQKLKKGEILLLVEVRVSALNHYDQKKIVFGQSLTLKPVEVAGRSREHLQKDIRLLGKSFRQCFVHIMREGETQDTKKPMKFTKATNDLMIELLNIL